MTFVSVDADPADLAATADIRGAEEGSQSQI